MGSTTDLYDSIARQAIPGYSAPASNPPACVLRNLSVLAYGNGFTLWQYRADDFREARAPGFFAPAITLTQPGDVVMVHSRVGAMQGWIDETGTLRAMEAV